MNDKTVHDILTEQLVGKTLKHVNKHNRLVFLEIEEVYFQTKQYEAWGERVKDLIFMIKFVDGSEKEFGLNEVLYIQ